MKGKCSDYGAIVVSGLVVVFFGLAMVVWMFVPVQEQNQTMLNMLVGALTASFVQVIGYWVGSSAGSKAKDDLLLAATPTTMTVDKKHEDK